eukprot:scaffold405427_cov22-Prasinocladus_malaysianus.AAC.1
MSAGTRIRIILCQVGSWYLVLGMVLVLPDFTTRMSTGTSSDALADRADVVNNSLETCHSCPASGTSFCHFDAEISVLT